MVVADTSFLFSLFGDDAHTSLAQAWARRSRQPISITVLGRYELENAIRFAAFRRVISERDALNTLAAFEADLKSGNVRIATCDLAQLIAEAERLSALHTFTGGHRSFDILHIAAARILKADQILTFDANQRRLADAVRLATAPEG